MTDVEPLEALVLHPGDTVLLRVKRRLTERKFEELRERLRPFEVASGVFVLLISDDVEVVPR